MPYKEREVEPSYWTIGDLADELMIATSNIRFWTREYPKLDPIRNNKNHRRFSRKYRSLIINFYYFVVIKKHTVEGAIDRMEELLNKTN